MSYISYLYNDPCLDNTKCDSKQRKFGNGKKYSLKSGRLPFLREICALHSMRELAKLMYVVCKGVKESKRERAIH